MRIPRFSIATALIAVGLLGVGFMLLVPTIRWLRYPNHLRVVNATGQHVRDIKVKLFTLDGELVVDESIPALADGGSWRMGHGLNDLRLEVRFEMDDREFIHREPYVDLWTGEEWCVTLRPSGSAVAEYSSER